MPSIKKRVTGFIRQFSAPSGAAAVAGANHNPAAKETVKGKSKSCGGGGGDNNGPSKILPESPPDGTTAFTIGEKLSSREAKQKCRQNEYALERYQ